MAQLKRKKIKRKDNTHNSEIFEHTEIKITGTEKNYSPVLIPL